MIDIKTFDAGMLCGEDTLFLGGSARKNATFAETVRQWTDGRADTPMVIFDHGGELYDSCPGEPLLADFSSVGSEVPDLLEPFLLNENTGSSPSSAAFALRQAVYQEIRSRDANDKFFDDLGKLATDRMLTYMLETEKNVLKNMAASSERCDSIRSLLPEINLFTVFCRQHRYIETLMTKVIGGESDMLPVRYRLEEQLALGKPLTHDFALSKYISEHEARFQKNGDKESLVPFADILMTNGENTNTQRCIKMQADASTADFRALIDRAACSAALYKNIKTLKLGEFINSANGRPLFVCSSGNTAADRGLAPLFIAALGAAADTAGKNLLILIPELDRWGLLNYIDKARQSWARVSFAFGYDNFSRLALESRYGEDQLIETLYSASTQRIWHATEEERLTKAFASYVSDADVIYRPQDLNDEIRAVESDGAVGYAAFEEGPARRLRSRTKLRESRRGGSLWITECPVKKEKLTLESLLEDGETL